ncbi:MAG: toll/interleukin-1 receptor domain-containing protein [Limisphaerales bacterium]
MRTSDPDPFTEADVFISHISEEAEVAMAVKDIIERHIPGPPKVFVSSDGESIKMGRDWLETVLKALGTCKAEVVVCSPKSVTRPWLNLEAGAALIRGIPVIPACHSGMAPPGLPLPLLLRQTSELTEIGGVERICRDLAGALHLGTAEIDFTRSVATIKGFEERYMFWDRCNAAFAAIAAAHPKIIALLRCHSCLEVDLPQRSAASIEDVLPFLRSNELLDFRSVGRSGAWHQKDLKNPADSGVGGTYCGYRILKLSKLDVVMGSVRFRPAAQQPGAAIASLPGWMVRPCAK